MLILRDFLKMIEYDAPIKVAIYNLNMKNAEEVLFEGEACDCPWCIAEYPLDIGDTGALCIDIEGLTEPRFYIYVKEE